MKYPAYVVENSPNGKDCPYPGCIKVVAPTILGYKDNIPKGATFAMKVDRMVRSGWVRPHYAHPEDHIIPELGEGVWIEPINDCGEFIWTGFFPREDFKNFVYKSQPEMTGVSQYAKVEKNKFKNRVIGTRFGSYMLFEDAWYNDTIAAGKRVGKFILEIGGKNKKFSDRVGPKIVIDSAEDAENFTLTVQNKDGSVLQTIVVDNKKDEENITITDKAGQVFKLDSKKDDESVSITDKAGQVFSMKSKSGEELVSIVDKSAQKFEMSSKTGSEGIVITDKESQTITMSAAAGKDKIEIKNKAGYTYVMDGVNKKITTTAGITEVSQDATTGKFKIKNSAIGLKDVLDAILSELENLTTTGSPVAHATSAASKATIAIVRNAKVGLLLE